MVKIKKIEVMKKKVLVFIATIALLLVGTASYISAQHDVLMDAGDQGGGGYIPESCTSSTNCMTNYSNRIMPHSGRVYCCSEHTPGVTGKAKA